MKQNNASSYTLVVNIIMTIQQIVAALVLYTVPAQHNTLQLTIGLYYI